MTGEQQKLMNKGGYPGFVGRETKVRSILLARLIEPVERVRIFRVKRDPWY